MAEFKPMGTLETERLLIRPFTLADLDVAHWLLDVELDWSGTREERSEWLQFTARLAKQRNPPVGYRAIVLKEGGAVVGKCGFFTYLISPAERTLYGKLPDPANHALNSMALGLGWGLARAFRGKGMASEAVSALIRFAIDELRAESLWARTTSDNANSRKLIERLGMMTAANPDPAAWPGVVGVLRHPLAAGIHGQK